MERSAPSPAINVVEPVRTRTAQMTMCASFVACLVVLRVLSVSYNKDQVPSPTMADYFCVPLALLTIINHLVVLILAFRQRRSKYRPSQIPLLIPTTAQLGVVISMWGLASFWIITTIFYLMDMRWRRGRESTWVFTAIEAGLVFAVAVMCGRERLETLERLRGEEDEEERIVFLVGEDGEYMVHERHR